MKEFKFVIDGHKYSTAVNEIGNNLAEVTVNGTIFRVEIEREESSSPVARPSVHHVVSSAQTGTQSGAAGIQVVKSPLPGSIVKVNVKVGDKVNVGDELLTMESMKMENSVKSEVSGTVKAVYIEPGKNVMQEDRLLEIETAASAPAAPSAAPAAAPAAPKAAPKADAPKPAAAPAAGFKVTSPLPGSVIKVLVTEGQTVKKGDTLLSLESMKMENAIMAEQDGTVKQICVSAGQNVMQDDLLIVLG
ncbi:MAG: biotin/lipoyl-binding protein [Paludibacteraceae bacterium]|nr:biotin/lipoyl-binding protein [Paludibacteraceae bacterium]